MPTKITRKQLDAAIEKYADFVDEPGPHPDREYPYMQPKAILVSNLSAFLAELMISVREK